MFPQLDNTKTVFDEHQELTSENARLRAFAEHCELVRRNFGDNGESDKAGAAYHLIFMSGKAAKALNLEPQDLKPELKPCPFCGSTAAHLSDLSGELNQWQIKCDRCGSRTQTANEISYVVSTWNNRIETEKA